MTDWADEIGMGVANTFMLPGPDYDNLQDAVALALRYAVAEKDKEIERLKTILNKVIQAADVPSIQDAIRKGTNDD